MEETRNIRIDDKIYKISCWLKIICIDNIPFAHIDEFNINIGDNYVMEFNNIELQLVPYECPEHLKDYIEENFESVV